jgi:hypothetical protein
MKQLSTLLLGLSLASGAALGALTPGCSASDAAGGKPAARDGGDDGSGGSGDSGGSGGSGNAGSGGGLGSGGTGTATGGMGPLADTCGGDACADHTGTHDFVGTGAPADAADTFDKATIRPTGTDAAHEPAIVYPSHETMFPINVSRIRHEWSGGTGNALYRLRFAGPKTTVNVYTADTNWLPSEEEWDWIAESNRGESVELSVAGIDPSAPTVGWTSAPITLLFSRAEVEGAIYYWSTGTKGVMKALVSDPIPEKFYTDPAAEDAGQCVACHTLSRDGKRLAVGYGGEKLREVSVPDRTVLVPASGGADRASAWTTFSPDGKKLLVAAAGKLTLIDADTGTPIGPNAGVVSIPAKTFATHPDWSALGDRVVVSLGTRGGNKEIEGGSIAVLGYTDGAWGAAEILIKSTGATDNNFFPVWSPDSKWIAFVNAAGKSKDAPSATLRLLEVDSNKVVTMARVNQRVNNENGVTGIGNSMPTWAPSTRPGTFWLAFSSLRAYANVRPQDEKEDQIWIAAIDPTLAPDPSYAGFWAPFQSVDAGNHRAFWTHTEGDKQCRCVDFCGDGLDNNCDGTADESTCNTCGPTEICGDGIDNDCNCVTDDCNVDEICGDGIDNDGDGDVDGQDRACQIR